MVRYQHRFEHVEDYLHHRPPYLMIDSIDHIAGRVVTATKRLRGDEFFLRGHFPGVPVVPGAILQEMTTQAAAILIAANYNPMEHYNTHDPSANEFALGVLVKVKHSRFRHFARPGDSLTITAKLIEQLGNTFDFAGKVSLGDEPLMTDAFQLINIPSRNLQAMDTPLDAI